MFKRIPSPEERLLGELLEKDAAESLPEFSESLHQAVFAAGRKRLARPSSVARRRRPLALAFALVAACLLAVAAIGLHLLIKSLRPAPVHENLSIAGPSIHDLPSIDDLTDHALGKLDKLTLSAALEQQTTPLKHDARKVAGLFLDRIPIDPMLLACNQNKK
jgi:hypothetical protein